MFFTKNPQEDKSATNFQEFRQCLAEANKLLDFPGELAKARKQLDDAGNTFEVKRASLIASKAEQMNQLKVGISQEALNRYSRLLKQWLEDYRKIAAPYQTSLDSMDALLKEFSKKIDSSYPNATAIQNFQENIKEIKNAIERYGYLETIKDLEKVFEVSQANATEIAKQRFPGLFK